MSDHEMQATILNVVREIVSCPDSVRGSMVPCADGTELEIHFYPLDRSLLLAEDGFLRSEIAMRFIAAEDAAG